MEELELTMHRLRHILSTLLVIATFGVVATVADDSSVPALDNKAAWSQEVEQLYEADMYPSREAALRYLMQSTCDAMRAKQDVPELSVTADNESLVESFAFALQNAGVDCGEEAKVKLTIAEISQDDRSTIDVTAQLPDGPFSRNVNYTAKDWLDDSTPEADRTIVRGLPSGSHPDVIDTAIQTEILPRIMETGNIRMDRQWQAYQVRARLRRELLHESNTIVDRFEQKFYKLIDGERHLAVAREAILIDTSEANMKELARSVSRDLRHGREMRKRVLTVAIAFILGMLFFVWLVHGLLDRLTQGYFAWPLRLVSAAVLLISCGLAAKIAYTMLH